MLTACMHGDDVHVGVDFRLRAGSESKTSEIQAFPYRINAEDSLLSYSCINYIYCMQGG